MCGMLKTLQVIYGFRSTRAELEQLGRRFLFEGAVGHLEAEVIAQGVAIALKEGPVEGGERAGVWAGGFFGVVGAVSAEVWHAVDVGSAGDVGLGRGDATV